MFEALLSLSSGGSLLPGGVIGQQSFTNAGTFSFVVPTDVHEVSAVVVGAGARGSVRRGGDLRWIKSLAVTPGETLTVVVGAGGVYGGPALVTTRILRGGTVLLEARNGENGTSTPMDGVNIGGGNGGTGVDGGGGAGGYSGNGGNNTGSNTGGAGQGGGGGAGVFYFYNGNAFGCGGGGVGLLGQGANGAGGTDGGNSGPSGLQVGKGGSGGAAGSGNDGGAYGGGGGSWSVAGGTGSGQKGGARIIWGTNRHYPSTNTQTL